MTIGVSAKAMRAPYRMKSAQSEVWNSLEMMSDTVGLGVGSAPTRSGIHMQDTQKAKLEDFSKNFKTIKNQAGMIGLVNNQVVAVELYGNPAAFKIFWNDLINSYGMEAILRSRDAKDLKPLDSAEIHDRALHCFDNFIMQYKERTGVGLGTIIEFADEKLIWAGTTLIHDNKFAHLYIIGKSIFPEEQTRTRQLRVSQLRRQMNQNGPQIRV
jgi:hypothetical protein